jgi:hypothetical protein
MFADSVPSPPPRATGAVLPASPGQRAKVEVVSVLHTMSPTWLAFNQGYALEELDAVPAPSDVRGGIADALAADAEHAIAHDDDDDDDDVDIDVDANVDGNANRGNDRVAGRYRKHGSEIGEEAAIARWEASGNKRGGRAAARPVTARARAPAAANGRPQTARVSGHAGRWTPEPRTVAGRWPGGVPPEARPGDTLVEPIATSGAGIEPHELFAVMDDFTHADEEWFRREGPRGSNVRGSHATTVKADDDGGGGGGGGGGGNADANVEAVRQRAREALERSAQLFSTPSIHDRSEGRASTVASGRLGYSSTYEPPPLTSRVTARTDYDSGGRVRGRKPLVSDKARGIAAESRAQATIAEALGKAYDILLQEKVTASTWVSMRLFFLFWFWFWFLLWFWFWFLLWFCLFVFCFFFLAHTQFVVIY